MAFLVLEVYVMRKRVLLVWAAGILLISLFTPYSQSHAEAPDAIRVGVTVSVSGKFSTEVGPFQRLCKAWVDEVNRRGGIYLEKYGRKLPLKLITYRRVRVPELEYPGRLSRLPARAQLLPARGLAG